MARPERNNVDYFPLYTDNGRKMFYIEQKYGNDGYATWLKILTELARTNYHYLDLKDETQIMYLSALCRIDITQLNNIINDLVKLGEFDKDLWDEKILFSVKFVDSVKDAYNKRNNECITLSGLRVLLQGLGRLKQGKHTLKGSNKPQSKVEYSKEEKNKEEIISDFEIFRVKYPGKKRGYETEIAILKKHKDWKSVLPLLQPALNGQIAARTKKAAAKEFVPEWPNLQTYLNQRRWEEVEGPKVEVKDDNYFDRIRFGNV